MTLYNALEKLNKSLQPNRLKLTYIQHPYTLTLNPCGGTISTKSRTILSDTYIGTLKNPTRKGYTFLGWYTDKACKKRITKIPAGSYGNLTLYAKWKVN